MLSATSPECCSPRRCLSSRFSGLALAAPRAASVCLVLPKHRGWSARGATEAAVPGRAMAVTVFWAQKQWNAL
eukprot:11214908-Lingulodinium_polyedra.AAC.1